MRSRLLWIALAAPSMAFGAASAAEILQHTAATYRNLQSYDFRVTVQTVHGSEASERHYGESGAGPGRFRIEWLDGRGELRMADGQTEWIYRPDSHQYSRKPLSPEAPTPISALAHIDQHVKAAQIARTESFLVDGKAVPVFVVDVERDHWPQGSLPGAQHTMYRIDQKTFAVYKAITYAPDATEIVLYSKARWNQPVAADAFNFAPPESAHEASLDAAPGDLKAIVGAAAPDFTLPDTGGHMVNLHELQGKVVIVDFWATWCPPCRALMPHLQKMYRDWEKRGLVVLGLDIGEDSDTVQRFAREQSYTFPLLLGAEPDVASKYYVEAYPTTFVIDRLGHIVFRDLGGSAVAPMQAAVEKALAGH